MDIAKSRGELQNETVKTGKRQNKKMAESTENVLSVISSQENKENEDQSFEPEPKKLRTDDSATSIEYKLEDRLTGILCCAVCLDLPGTCFQVILRCIFNARYFTKF